MYQAVFTSILLGWFWLMILLFGRMLSRGMGRVRSRESFLSVLFLLSAFLDWLWGLGKLTRSFFSREWTSLRSSIMNYHYENGRRYHAYHAGSYWYSSTSYTIVSSIN